MGLYELYVGWYKYTIYIVINYLLEAIILVIDFHISCLVRNLIFI